jgi:hypothetical protein
VGACYDNTFCDNNLLNTNQKISYNTLSPPKPSS